MSGEAYPRFARRIGALLVLEREPRAANEPEGRGEAIAFLRAEGGDAEPRGADGVVAAFDRPPQAISAATRLHRHAARAGVAWRAGLRVDNVVFAGAGTVELTAIEGAASLAGMARAGTTAVLAADVPLLGPLRDATLEPAGEPGGVAIQLVAPRAEAMSLERRALVVVASAAALGGAGAVAWMVARARRADERHLTLGVGPFALSGTEGGSEWIGRALRDGVNTQLSELEGVRVFSDEFVDFVMSREHLTALEVAQRLGIEKMVSGAVVVVGDTVRVEARIIDVATGLLEGAYVTNRRAREFLALETDVVAGVIAKLDLHLAPEDERRLTARRSTDLEALRRLLEAEGESGAAQPPDLSEPPPEEPHSWLPDGLGPRAAVADEAEAAIMAFLEEYRRATEARDVDRLGRLYVGFAAGQREALERFFGSVRDLHVTIDRVEIAVVGEEAVVTYTRTDDFVDVPTAGPQHVSVRLTKTLRRVDGRWRFAAGR